MIAFSLGQLDLGWNLLGAGVAFFLPQYKKRVFCFVK